jgi:hypothetical protein
MSKTGSTAMAALAVFALAFSHAGFAQDTAAPPDPTVPDLMRPALAHPAISAETARLQPAPASPPPAANPDAAAKTPAVEALAPAGEAPAGEAPAAGSATADSPASADDIADIFSKLGDQIYEDCIFDLSEEQINVQAALILAYMDQGAESAVARRLAAIQIQAPKLSAKCEQMRRAPPPPVDWTTTTEAQEPPPEAPAPTAAKPPKPVIAATPKVPVPELPPPVVALAGKQVPSQWDCADGVDYVTITLNGYKRKLTGGEICNPFEDVAREVPASAGNFRLGYTISTGRLFVISDNPAINGQTISWGLSGRDVCRNNPDPDCFAARAVGPLPPGEYAFAAEKKYRVSWGPKTKRHVAAIYLKTLFNKERFSPAHIAAIKKRGNIAIHVRLKGEMSEACIGLEPKGWAYVASLIKDGRATGLTVHIDEPYPKIAEAPPVIVASSFSLTSLFK